MKKARSGRGGLDLCQGIPGVDPEHGVRDSHPTREEAQGAPPPGGYPPHTAQGGPKGPITPSWKTLLHAPRSDRGGGLPLPHLVCTESGGSGPGVTIYGLSSRVCGLEGAHLSGGILDDTPGGNRLLGPIWGSVTRLG